jgi:hypothetical protein
MDILPGPHANVLIFLMSFIRQILEWPVFIQNPEAKRRTGRICRLWLIVGRAFAKVLIRSPMNSSADDLRKKETLLSRLLAES